jgi:hypothetical protein
MTRIATTFLLLATGALAADLRSALTLHASFDRGIDADFAAGDARLYTAPSYKEQQNAKPGLDLPHIAVAPGAGRFGDALRFTRKNTNAVFYKGEKNVQHSPRDWSGTISFWLSLDPDQDLEPGFCDPIQVTDQAYNDGAIWVDFTKDDKPRHFRLGIFGDLSAWNPQNIPPEKNPVFEKRLVAVTRPPFGRGRWTHVAITYSRLGTDSGSARLYLNGEPQGRTQPIREPFTWDLARAAIRLGVNYVGLFDELAIFNRALAEQEVRELYQLPKGVAGLRR